MIISFFLYYPSCRRHYIRCRKIYSESTDKFLYSQFLLRFCRYFLYINKPVCFCWTNTKRIKKLLYFFIRFQDVSTVINICLFRKYKQCPCQFWLQEWKPSAKPRNPQLIFAFIICKATFCFKIILPLSFTLIRKYSQQLIINADKQGANKSREHITSISGRLSAFLLRNRTPFLRVDI